MELTRDLLWHVLCILPARQLVRMRAVSRDWRDCVDAASQDDWKRIYATQVCDGLLVGTSFDWKRAAIVCSNRSDSVNATCTWNSKRVRLAIPWTTPTNTINPSLRAGVLRRVPAPAVIDFVYDNMFLLRGWIRTCRARSAELCRNCQAKQRCLVPRYDYFLRPMHAATLPQHRDESLGLLLSSQTPLQVAGDDDR